MANAKTAVALVIALASASCCLPSCMVALDNGEHVVDGVVGGGQHEAGQKRETQEGNISLKSLHKSINPTRMIEVPL